MTANDPPEPSLGTLKRYGLTTVEWRAMLSAQGGVCPICLAVPKRWHTDHQHVRGWKSLSPAERKKHVRGICCAYCNRHVLRKNMTATRFRRAADYLERHLELMDRLS